MQIEEAVLKGSEEKRIFDLMPRNYLQNLDFT